MSFFHIFFLKSSLSINLRQFMIEQYAPLLSLFLIQGRTHCFRFLLSFIYVLGSVTNHLKKLLTILLVCCYPMSPFLKNNRAFYIFALKSVYFKNVSKIISKYSKNICNNSVQL